jgi:anaerobic magnesium-protoporphyrin IX monomethyl ester cyclase
MKICLVRPPILVPVANLVTTYTPPVGLAYVAGALREAQFELCFIDGLGESLDTRHDWVKDCYICGLTLEQIVERIPDDVEMIGVHAGFSFDWPMCQVLIKLIRERFPNITIIGGGEHVSAVPEESLLESELDIVVCGEGEETAVEIARAVEKGNTNFESITGIAFHSKGGKFIKTDPRPRLTNVNEIPSPAWEITPLREYLDRGFGYGVNRGRSMPIVASRGCPYQCTFCSSPNMWTTRWVIRDPELLLDEMEKSMATYGATNFDFYDLTFVLNKRWLIDFCSKIVDRGLNITWQLPAGTRSEAIDSEVGYWMHRSGCRNMTYTPESGSPSVLKRIKKKVNPESMISSIRGTVKEGINVKVNLIFGFPDDTIGEYFETYSFIIKMALAGAHDLSIWGFSPYPGTELFDRLSLQNRVKLDDEFYDSLRTYSDQTKITSYSENFSKNGIQVLRILGLSLFYSMSFLRRPIRPFLVVKNLVKGVQESRMDRGISDAIRRLMFFRANTKQ